MSNRKTCRAHAIAAATLALLFARSGFAQNGAFNTDEPGLRARDQAALDQARAAIDADKKRPRIAGIWRVTAPATAIKTVDGKLPPMTAAAQKLYRERVANRRAGKTHDPLEQCLPPGTPRSLWSGEPVLITQTPAKVTLFHQYRHLIRHVFLDGLNPEGVTLRIQTVGFNGEQWLDAAGLPQSPDMKVDEALRLLDANTLEDTVTVADGRYYEQPWSTRVIFKRLPDDTFMPEEECSEKLLEFPLKPYAPSDGGSGHGSR